MIFRCTTHWIGAMALGMAACAFTLHAAPVIPPSDMLVSRTNGVAPLSVYFDASGTTSGVTAIPFHELGYRWDFGDPGSGAWATDGKSKNSAAGPQAGHVYHMPGVYTATLTVQDMAGGQATRQMVIVVDDPAGVFPGTNTVCFSQDGNFDGAPAGARLIITNRFAAVAAYFSPRMRLLLRRGETWTNASVRLNSAGPGIIGAFGAGAPPVLVAPSNTTLLTLSSSSPRLDDWRVMDLELDGSAKGSWAVLANGVVTRVLLLRLGAHDFLGGVNISTSILDYYKSTSMYDQVSLEDMTLTHFIGGGGGNIGFICSRRLSIQGCVMHDSRGVEHILRTPWISKGVICHNDMRDQALAKHVIKMHAPQFNAPGIGSNQHTELVVLSDNTFSGNADWTVCLGPQDNGKDERVRDILVERNFFLCNSNVQVNLLIWGREITARNNIFNTTDGKAQTCVWIGPRGIEPAPENVRVFNNTGYTADTKAFRLVQVQPVVTNTTVRNNLASAPYSTSPTMVYGSGVNLVMDHNLLTSAPGFAISNPVAAADFALVPVSPALNAGTNIAVFEDYAMSPRPVGTMDLGAYEWLPEPAVLGMAAVFVAGLRGRLRRRV